MPLHITGLSSLYGVGVAAPSAPLRAILHSQLTALCDAWAAEAHKTYAIRGSEREFRKLLQVGAITSPTPTHLRSHIHIMKTTTPLSTFQFVNEANAGGGEGMRTVGKRTIQSRSRSTPRSPSAKVRALRSSQFKLVVDKRTGTKGWWYAAKGALFARDQQATWSGGARLPIHRMLTVPLAVYLNSTRVRGGLGLEGRVALLGGTVRRIA